MMTSKHNNNNKKSSEEQQPHADAVSRMVLRVELLEDSGKPGFKGLTAAELQELSFLCTMQDCAAKQQPPSSSTTNRNKDGSTERVQSSTGDRTVHAGPRIALGTRFLKEFEGAQYEGKVMSFDGDHYHIYYAEDGDEEEISEWEFDNLEITHTPSAVVQPVAQSSAAETEASGKKQEKNDNNQSVVGFASVEGDPLVALIELLDHHVNSAVSVRLIESAIEVYQAAGGSPTQANAALDLWFKKGEGKAKLAALRGGLEAAAIVLFIATTPNVDPRAIHEDAIEACITLLRLHLTKHLVPALNQTGHFVGAASAAEPTSPGGKKRRRSSGNAGAGVVPPKDLKKVYKHIHNTIQLQLVLMDRFERLIQQLPLDDQQILLLANGALPALEIDCSASPPPSKSVPPAQQLQLASIGIITAAFRKYPLHRDTILEDLFPVMLNLPTGKRSLRAFPVSYESAASPSALEALNAQTVGSLLGNQELPHYIQMMTALVMSLVQACVVRPTYPAVEENEQGEPQPPGRLQSGLQSAQAIADSFVAQLLKRCTRTKGGEVSEFRPVLANLVEDLLLVLIIPEYPAAELLVSALQLRLNQDLTRASPVFNKQTQFQVEATYLNSAFDAMGKICMVQARILATSRAKPIRMITDVPMSPPTNDDEVKCHCQQSLEDVFAVACDHCNTLFHGQCVEMPDRDSVPEQWYCDPCTLGKIALREQRKLLGGEAAFVDENYVLQHSFQSVTAHRLGVDMDDAVHFHLARWIDAIERRGLTDDSLKAHPRRIVAQLLEYWDDPGPAAEPLTEEGGVRVILALLANISPLFRSFRKQIGFLLKIMADESTHALRKLSLKCIEKTVEADQELMLLPVITKAVSRRLSDESISVREAAVSLVGSYAVKEPKAIQSYHSALLPCLSDQGVSVRKRAVKIFQIILTKNPRYKERSEVYNVLLERSADLKEEDAVRDLIDDLFCALWLRDGSDELSPEKKRSDSMDEETEKTEQAATIPGVVTPSSPPPAAKRKKSQRRADVAAEQMMECVLAGGTGDSLEALLQKLLNGSIDSDNSRKRSERQKRQEVGLQQCTLVVDALFELLMVVEEQRGIRSHVGKDIAATLVTIAVFANVSPHAVLKNLDTILPYLKADNGVSMSDESAIVCATCDILYRLSAASAIDQTAIMRLATKSVAKDLTNICCRFGPAALGSSVRAFAKLAHNAGNESSLGAKLLSLAKTFYRFLLTNKSIADFDESSRVPKKTKNNAHRALMVLGLICENQEGSVDAETWGDVVQREETELLSLDELSWGNFTLACYRLFKFYLQKVDSGTKCKALAALRGIFVANPQLLLQMDHVGLFDEVMDDSAGIPLQLEALECWKKILINEEHRIDDGIADAKMEADGNITVSKKISGDQDGDATLFGGVLTSHSGRLFEMIHSTSPVIRQSTLELLGLLLRQGLVNPNEAVPHLFALQGDVENDSIRSHALRLLVAEGEKRPDTLRQLIRSGVKQAYAFQRHLNPDNTQVSAIVQNKNGEIASIFDKVFPSIANNRKQRLSLYKSLLGLFDLEDDSISANHRRNSKSNKTKSTTSKDLALLSFAAQILAHLPYNTAGDPLYIVHTITNQVTLQGLHALEKLASFLRPYGLSSSDDLEETNTEEDALEIAAQSKFPSRTTNARPLSSQDFDITGFADLCRDGAALTLLLRLKSFLSTSYNLSASRILEYDPNAKERVCERGIPKPKFTAPFDASLESVMTDGTVDKDALIRVYAEFRQMMRNENQISTHNSSDDTDKEEDEDEDEDEDGESPAKRRRSSGSDDGDDDEGEDDI